MSTKTITITEEAYQKLKMRKKENESFSEVINRVLPYTDWSEFIGVLSPKSAALLKMSINENRRDTEEKLLRLNRLMKGQDIDS